MGIIQTVKKQRSRGILIKKHIYGAIGENLIVGFTKEMVSFAFDAGLFDKNMAKE